MDRKFCAKVWDLSNSHAADTFTKPMFFIAMHLMYKKKLNPMIELPGELPLELIHSSQDEGAGQPRQAANNNAEPHQAVPSDGQDPRGSFLSSKINPATSQTFAPSHSKGHADLMV